MAAAPMVAVLPYRMTAAGGNAASAASLARDGSFSPLRGAVPAAWYGRGLARTGGVLPQPGTPGDARRKPLQLFPGAGGAGRNAGIPASKRPASISAMRRPSHSRDAEVMPLITSLASTGTATGRLTTAA